MPDNCITIVGNVTDAPELRFTASGVALATFTVAVNRRVKGHDGWEDKLEGFFRCSVWREQAENAAESLDKGMRVVVIGRLSQRSWETQDGQKRSEVEISVDEVAPSLRWATATVKRLEKSTASGSSQAPGTDQGGW